MGDLKPPALISGPSHWR